MKLSIAIPCYESHGRGVEFLDFQFYKLKSQTFKDFQVVLSDHSINNDIEDFCKKEMGNLDIKYLRNEKSRGSSPANTNKAIKNCDGEIIKIIFQDDFLWSKNSLKKTVDFFKDDDQWLISGCIHTFDDGKTFVGQMKPYYHDLIYLGKNTISSPSVLSIRNSSETIFFDERVDWLMDVDYYKSLHDKFGPPKILNEITVVNRDWGMQMSKKTTHEAKMAEEALVREKYE